MNVQSIIVKLKYEDDFRRATLSLSKINTYDAMACWIAATYNLQDGAQNLLLKYKDEGKFDVIFRCLCLTYTHFLDGDLITMINDDDFQHAVTTQQKLFIHVFFADDKIALNNSSRLASPIKSDLAAVIHPSNHNEEEQEFAAAASPSSSNNEMSPPQQQPSYPGKSETPINFSSSNGILHQQQQGHHHQSPSSQSRSAIREHFDSSRMNGMPPQQQQLHPSSYPQSVNGQHFAPPLMSGLPPQQPPQLHHQLQQRPSYNGLPPPSSSQQHPQQQPQQSMPSYPLQSGPSQHIAPPPSMNGLPPLSIQQQQQQPPSYSSQPTTQQSYAPPPSMNGLQPQNGLAPPPSLQQQHHRQGQPQMSYPPVSAPPTHYGPPPTSTLPGNGNPFSRQQFQQRPSQL